MGKVSITLSTLKASIRMVSFTLSTFEELGGGVLLLFSRLKAPMGRVSITLFTFEGLDGDGFF